MPLTALLLLGTLADLGRSKSELMAENALLRQQLITLKRQVKRPTCTKLDRLLLVLLARMVRTWKRALLIVQTDDRSSQYTPWLVCANLPHVLLDSLLAHPNAQVQEFSPNTLSPQSRFFVAVSLINVMVSAFRFF